MFEDEEEMEADEAVSDEDISDGKLTEEEKKMKKFVLKLKKETIGPCNWVVDRIIKGEGLQRSRDVTAVCMDVVAKRGIRSLATVTRYKAALAHCINAEPTKSSRAIARPWKPLRCRVKPNDIREYDYKIIQASKFFRIRLKTMNSLLVEVERKLNADKNEAGSDSEASDVEMPELKRYDSSADEESEEEMDEDDRKPFTGDVFDETKSKEERFRSFIYQIFDFMDKSEHHVLDWMIKTMVDARAYGDIPSVITKAKVLELFKSAEPSLHASPFRAEVVNFSQFVKTKRTIEWEEKDTVYVEGKDEEKNPFELELKRRENLRKAQKVEKERGKSLAKDEQIEDEEMEDEEEQEEEEESEGEEEDEGQWDEEEEEEEMETSENPEDPSTDDRRQAKIRDYQEEMTEHREIGDAARAAAAAAAPPAATTITASMADGVGAAAAMGIAEVAAGIRRRREARAAQRDPSRVGGLPVIQMDDDGEAIYRPEGQDGKESDSDDGMFEDAENDGQCYDSDSDGSTPDWNAPVDVGEEPGVVPGVAILGVCVRFGSDDEEEEAMMEELKEVKEEPKEEVEGNNEGDMDVPGPSRTLREGFSELAHFPSNSQSSVGKRIKK